MSYCRFSEGDVYAYACEGGVQFWVADKKLNRLCNTYDSAYQYAKYLRDECGLDVPSHAIDALRADAIDESNHGDGSAVAEIVSENAKLRELVRDMWCNMPKSESCGWDTDANCCTGCDECGGECSYWYRMRELGIEVR